MKRWIFLGLVCLAGGVVAGVCAAQTGDIVSRIREDPSLLRDHRTLKRLMRTDPGSYQAEMIGIAADSGADWDLRSRALTLVVLPETDDLTAAFVEDFDPQKVAADEFGADSFNILADWLRGCAKPPPSITRLLVPVRRGADVAPVLQSLAGQPLHPYLRWLAETDYRLSNGEITAIAATDDQLTRQFLSWLVGAERRRDMAGFLVSQITSDRPSSYRSQVDRFLVAALTVGIGEIIRQAAPTPRWLEDDVTPKGLALESLAALLPSDLELTNPAIVDPLLQAATVNAAGKNRSQWQLAIDILDFLHLRKVPLSGRADEAVAHLVRQPVRTRGPLEAFVAAERLHRDAGIPFPELSEADTAAIWGQCFKTLNAAFLGAVVRALPDDEQHAALQAHLLSLAEQAARGSLRVTRCWGADLEGPGEWARAVSELGLNEAIPAIARILEGPWNDDAVVALSAMGRDGAEALARFLLTPGAAHLDRAHRDTAVAACARSLDPTAWARLRAHLLADPVLAASLP